MPKGFATVLFWDRGNQIGTKASKVTQNDTKTGTSPSRNLPLPLTGATARPSLARSATLSPFLSQLIAERQHLMNQRQRRRASIETALGAYDRGSNISVRRVPQGYRKTVLA